MWQCEDVQGSQEIAACQCNRHVAGLIQSPDQKRLSEEGPAVSMKTAAGVVVACAFMIL